MVRIKSIDRRKFQNIGMVIKMDITDWLAMVLCIFTMLIVVLLMTVGYYESKIRYWRLKADLAFVELTSAQRDRVENKVKKIVKG